MRCKVAPGRRIYFEGRDRVEGEIIDVPEKQGKLLIKLGRAANAEHERPLRVADPQPARPLRAPETRDLLSEESSGSGAEEPKRRARRYMRTDMRSED